MGKVARMEETDKRALRTIRRARAKARAMMAKDMAVVEAHLPREAIAWEGSLSPQQGYHHNSP